MPIDHYAKGKVSQVSGFWGCWFAANRTIIHKIIIPGISWAMLIKSSSMQTTVVQTIIYTLVTQLVKIVQQFITTTLTSM